MDHSFAIFHPGVESDPQVTLGFIQPEALSTTQSHWNVFLMFGLFVSGPGMDP